jgi:hypothetical protein
MAALSSVSGPAFGQATPYYQQHFPPEEFKARWEKVFDRVGNNTIAIIQGGPKGARVHPALSD